MVSCSNPGCTVPVEMPPRGSPICTECLEEIHMSSRTLEEVEPLLESPVLLTREAHAAVFGQGTPEATMEELNTQATIWNQGEQAAPPRAAIFCCFYSRKYHCRHGRRCKFIHGAVTARTQAALANGDMVLMCEREHRFGHCYHVVRGDHA